MTIYDFAGHREYYAGHGAVLHNSLAGSPSIILLVVDVRDVDERFRENLQYWLEFASHADQCKHQNKKIELITTTAKSLNLSGLALKGTIMLDCRFAESASMRKVRSLLSNSCQALRSPEQTALLITISLYSFWTNSKGVQQSQLTWMRRNCMKYQSEKYTGAS